MRAIHKFASPRSVIDTQDIVTPLQLDALMYLSMHPKSPVGAIGDYLELSSSAIAQLTDRLRRSGFIKRESNPADRRTVLLSLTPKGEKVFSHLHQARLEKAKELLAVLSENDIKDLMRVFKKIHQTLEGREKSSDK